MSKKSRVVPTLFFLMFSLSMNNSSFKGLNMKRQFYRKFNFKGINKEGVKVSYGFTLFNDDPRLSPEQFFERFNVKSLNLNDEVYDEIVKVVTDTENKISRWSLMLFSWTFCSKGYSFKYTCRPNFPLLARLFYFVSGRRKNPK